jgi:uncharacterized protein (TIGR03067 family)
MVAACGGSRPAYNFPRCGNPNKPGATTSKWHVFGHGNVVAARRDPSILEEFSMHSNKAWFFVAFLTCVCLSTGCGDMGGRGSGDPNFPLAGTTWIAEESYWNGEGGKPQSTEKVIFRDDFNQINMPDFMGSYHMSTNGSPKTLVITIISAHSQGQMVHGIWERDGDQLKLAFGRGNSPLRPKDFTPRKGDEMSILILKKAK